MGEFVIDLSEAAFGYNGKLVVDRAKLRIHEGELTGIIGRNGTGKSTLLKGLLGLIQPYYGAIQIHGFPGVNTTTQLRKFLGYVPQRSSLNCRFPAVVKDVVLMGLYAKLAFFQRPKRPEHDKVEAILEQMEISQLANVQVGQLSGGEFQRMLIARALIAEPRILCLDEPTAAIDEASEVRIFDFITSLVRAQGVTVVLVSHNQSEVRKRADRVLVLN